MTSFVDEDFGGLPGPQAGSIVDYWTGPPLSQKWYFPDGVQYIEYQPLTHGQRSQYMSKINRELTIEKTTGNARMRTDIMSDTNILIDMSCVGWNVFRQGEQVVFSHGSPGSTLNQFLNQADPRLVDGLEKAIRDANPWLAGDKTADEVRQQIKELEDELKQIEERDAGK